MITDWIIENFARFFFSAGLKNKKVSLNYIFCCVSRADLSGKFVLIVSDINYDGVNDSHA